MSIVNPSSLPSPEEEAVCDAVAPFTMTPATRVLALIRAVRWLDARSIQGAFVECGVWRGGSILAAGLAAAAPRHLHLFDTFSGMTPPQSMDVDVYGVSGSEITQPGQWAHCLAPLEEVKNNLRGKLDRHTLHYHIGPVEETLPGAETGPLALLRLDTDFYSSTLHTLRSLWPRLAVGGVCIIDDYGHWRGCAKACNEFFGHEPGFELDYTARLLIKTGINPLE